MKYIIKRNDQDYVINTDGNGLGGYNVVPKSVDPHNAYTIEEVEAYIAEHPEDVLDMDVVNAKIHKAQIRQQRDTLIQSVEWRVRRHQDEMTLGLEPTEDIIPILEYIQALREVPQQPGFPDDILWPQENCK